MQELKQSSERLRQVLIENLMMPRGGTALFQWVSHSNAKNIFEIFAKHGVLVRCFDGVIPSLRFGLPANEEQWQRLNSVLKMLTELIKVTELNDENKLSHV